MRIGKRTRSLRILLILSPVLLFITMAAAAPKPAPRGPIAHWPFDVVENRTTPDRAGGTHSARLHGDPPAMPLRPGTGDMGSLAFTHPGQSVSGSDKGFPAGARPGSISVWFCRPKGVANKVLFCYGPRERGRARGLWLVKEDQLCFYFWGDPKDLHAKVPAGIAPETWHHVVATYDGRMARLYYDGKLLGRVAHKLNTGLGGRFYMGRNLVEDDGRDFLGLLADVAVYGRALSADEVASQYKQGAVRLGSAATAMAAWRKARKALQAKLDARTAESFAQGRKLLLDAGVREIVFAVRQVDADGHWYANFGTNVIDPKRRYYHDGGRLCRLDVATGHVDVLIDDPTGGVRDPQVHYDGRRVLFSYRPGHAAHYHLYEMPLPPAKPQAAKPPSAASPAAKPPPASLAAGPSPASPAEVRPPASTQTPASAAACANAPAAPHADPSAACGLAKPKLRQLTDGPFDDLEPTYLPDGGIAFVSSRCKRWVPCYYTQVAVLYRCDADGRNIRRLSANVEHENTPWPLPDGRLLYQRWEYVDRSQVGYHHLWTMNPDGSGQMVFYGNQHPNTVMIDAKPIPGTRKIVASFSPGHGRNEHSGFITIVDPSAGPDESGSARRLSNTLYRDPYPLAGRADAEALFLVVGETRNWGHKARGGDTISVLTGTGKAAPVWRLSGTDTRAGLYVHEPRPIRPRRREAVIPPRSAAAAKPQAAIARNGDSLPPAPRATPPAAPAPRDVAGLPNLPPSAACGLASPTGHVLLEAVHTGRNMAGVKPGEIKRLLVVEILPKPLNIFSGMEPLSYGGTFLLSRVLGTVPVEPDGSAYVELPAMRALTFVALDADGLAVKRMQSFLTVQPGETLSCVGCHEQRVKTPRSRSVLAAMKRGPARITPLAGVPDLIDFPRDVQPILDRHCVACHDYRKTARGGPASGGVVLCGDRGPMFSHSYYMLTIAGQFSAGRNLRRSNYAPRALGSSASAILRKVRPDAKGRTHHDVKLTPREIRILQVWIDTGAAYPGTYAAMGTGSIGDYRRGGIDRADVTWPEIRMAQLALKRRCASCHTGSTRLPDSPSDNRGLVPWGEGPMNALATGTSQRTNPTFRFNRHLLYNLSRPECSLLLLAPLDKAAGGYGVCKSGWGKAAKPARVFADTADKDYQTILAGIRRAADHLHKIKRFDMPGFQPGAEYIREMKRFGILPAKAGPDSVLDVYELDRAYWRISVPGDVPGQ